MWKGSSSLSCWPASRSALQRSTLTRQTRCWKTEKNENAEWCITLPALLEAEARCDCSSLEWIHSPSLGLCFHPVWKRRETSNLFFFLWLEGVFWMVTDPTSVALHQRKADNWAQDKSSVCYYNKLRFKSVSPHNSKLFIFFSLKSFLNLYICAKTPLFGTKYFS